MTKSPVASSLPADFQDRVFDAIAVQRPVVLAFIREVRRAKPDATPAEVMKIIESRYVAATTTASAAVGASAAIPAVGIPLAIGLGVADLIMFYEMTALFALCAAELRGLSVESPERARAIVLGAILGEKRRSQVTQIILSALPGGVTLGAARTATATAAAAVPKWGDLLAQQLPDSALVPVTMVLAKQAIAQGAVIGTVKISSKAVPVIGAVAGGATSYLFGAAVVKSCRDGFSPPVDAWPAALDLVDADGDGIPDPPKGVLAMQAAGSSAKDFGEEVWQKLVAGTAVFRKVDLDGDGVPDESRALTATKNVVGAVGEATGTAARKVGGSVASGFGAIGERVRARRMANAKPEASDEEEND